MSVVDNYYDNVTAESFFGLLNSKNYWLMTPWIMPIKQECWYICWYNSKDNLYYDSLINRLVVVCDPGPGHHFKNNGLRMFFSFNFPLNI